LTLPSQLEGKLWNTTKIIFFRNFLSDHLSIGAAFRRVLFYPDVSFWNTWSSWVASFFKVDEKSFVRLWRVVFMDLRIVLVFLFRVPALALPGWQEKKQ